MANYPEYSVYRGLQKPFSLFGLKGVNVAWGMGGAILSFVSFIVLYSVSGFWAGLIAVVLILSVAGYKIAYHLSHGLRTKQKMPGVWVFKNLVKPTFR